MNLLEAFVETSVAGMVGLTILHSLWQGAIVAAALGVILLTAQSPRIRYAASCVAMVLIVIVCGLTLVRLLPDVAEGRQAVQAPFFLAWSLQPAIEAVNAPNRGLAAIAPWLAPFWAAGVGVSCLWHVFGWLSARRLRRRGVCCAPERWRNALAQLGARLQLSRPVLLLESCLVDTPMVLGHFRPLILMPIGLLARLPVGQVEAILLHELAHIRRYDYLANHLQRVVEGLLFYHPVVWWISGVMRAEREKCCDDMVVAMNGDAHEYAIALATLEQDRWSGVEPAVAASGGSLVKRIHRLLYPTKSNVQGMPLPAALVLAALTALALAACSAAVPPGETEGSENKPHLRWLNQDVVYIIADEERAAFQRLATDEERERFVEQFWLRRDPTPRTPKNEYREEHYRRIAFANERFETVSDRLGWQSDRGRICIVYGPPDEIEVHPVGSSEIPYPFEVWRYRHVESLGKELFITFIDRTKRGDYRIAPGSAR